jgi:hypothetical protein
MKNTKAVSKVIVSLLCTVLLFNSLPLNAAGAGEEIRHEAFLRGGNAISTALNTPTATAPVVSKALVEETSAAVPPAPAPAPARRQDSSKGMSKWVWAALIGGFATGGAVVYWVATGPGASIRNCSSSLSSQCK